MDTNIVKLFIEFGQKSYTQVVKITNKFPAIIGREAPDVTIKDPMLSRKHCQLFIELGQLYVEDLGSVNGVEVNGATVKRTRLKLDDRIKVGSTRIKIIHIELATPKKRKGSGF